MNRPLQRRIRVIFIEDSDAHVRLYTDMLEKAFFCTFIVTVRKTLKGGLSQLSKNPFDICLLDLNLPESRGLESLAAVQKHAPHIPIVVLTGDETDDLVFKAVQQGAEDCLIKGKVDAPLLERSLAHCVDRSQLNQKIHDRENLFRSFYENSLDALLITSPDGDIFSANPGACALFEMSEQEIIDRGREGLVAPGDKRLQKLLHEREKKGRATGELDMVKKDTTVFPVEISSQVFTTYRGESRTSMVIHDISGRRAAEQKIIDSEQRFRNLVETIPYGIEEVDRSGKKIFTNSAYNRMLGYEPGELTNTYIWDLEPDKHKVLLLKEYFRELIENHPPPKPYVSQNVRKDGRIIDVYIDWNYRRDSNNRIAGFIAVVTDITKQKAMKEELKEQRATLHSIFQAAPIGIGIVDNRVIRWTNEHMTQMLGYTAREMLGKNSRFLYPDEEEYERVGKVKYEQIDDHGQGSVETRFRKKDGSCIHVLLSSAVTDYPKQKRNNVVFTALDITERKEAEQALLESELRYRSLFESGTAKMMLIEPGSGSLVDANTSICDYFGYSKKELLHRNMKDLIHLSEEKMHSQLQQAMEGNLSELRIRVNLCTGATRDVEIFTSPLKLEGKILLFCILYDITDQLRAKRELEKSEQKFRAITDTASDAIVLMDNTGRISFWNQAAESMFGYTKEEALGEDLHLLIAPEEYHDSYRAGFSRFQRTGKGPAINNTLEFHALKKGGEIFPIEVSTSAIQKEGMWQAVGIIRDISERKSIEQALRRSERTLSNLMSNLPGMVYRCRFEKNRPVEFVSEGTLSLTGYDPMDLINNEFIAYEEIIHPEDRQSVWDGVNESLKEDSFFKLIYRIRTKRGQTKWVLEQGTAIHKEDGSVEALEGFITDITDRIQAEQKLETQFQDLSLLNRISKAIPEQRDVNGISQVVLDLLQDTKNMPLASIWGWEPELKQMRVLGTRSRKNEWVQGLNLAQNQVQSLSENGLCDCMDSSYIMEGNTKYCRYPLGSSLAEYNLKSFLAVPLLFRQRILGILLVAKDKKDGFHKEELSLYTNLGEILSLAMHQTFLFDDLKNAYIHLKETREAALQQERLRALGQMASGIVHDINNALSPIVGYTDLLMDESMSLGSEAQQYLKMIRTAAKDISHVVTGMREFYRKRDQEEMLLPVDLNALCVQVKELTRPRWRDMPQEQGQTVRLELELTEDIPSIPGIESELREAVTNLVFNAVDALPTGGKVILRTLSTDRGILLEVEDNGTGMDEQTRHQCLEPFFTTKGKQGTGLGLGMVYGTMQRHDGKLEVDTRLDRGTAMRLIFPRKESMKKELRQGDENSGVPPKHILCIDDEQSLRELLSDMLKRDNHTVVTAGSGQEGIDTFLKSLDQEPFDLVITDLGMPGVDGRAVVKRIKNASPKTPVILLTGWGTRMSSEETMPPGVELVLNKPPTLANLRNALEQIHYTSDASKTTDN